MKCCWYWPRTYQIRFSTIRILMLPENLIRIFPFFESNLSLSIFQINVLCTWPCVKFQEVIGQGWANSDTAHRPKDNRRRILQKWENISLNARLNNIYLLPILFNFEKYLKLAWNSRPIPFNSWIHIQL